jgi:hypothetical protein
MKIQNIKHFSLLKKGKNLSDKVMRLRILLIRVRIVKEKFINLNMKFKTNSIINFSA